MREINTKPEFIILEPIGRNTAPAVALGAIKAKSIEEDPILLILPADHVIKNIDQFINTINKGFELAKRERLSLLELNLNQQKLDSDILKQIILMILYKEKLLPLSVLLKNQIKKKLKN